MERGDIMVKNTMKLVQSAEGHIDVRYGMYTQNITDIKEGSENIFDMIVNGFRFGYMQGMKAARAEMKKGGASV